MGFPAKHMDSCHHFISFSSLYLVRSEEGTCLEELRKKPENGEKKIFTMSKARKGIIRVKNNVCLSHKQIEARCILSQKYEINAIIAIRHSTMYYAQWVRKLTRI